MTPRKRIELALIHVDQLLTIAKGCESASARRTVYLMAIAECQEVGLFNLECDIRALAEACKESINRQRKKGGLSIIPSSVFVAGEQT